MNGALDRLRVLDFGQGVAGPYCGQLLADHGADVIKIEPPRGDWSRTMGAQDGTGMSGTFVSVNRGKRSLCLNMKEERALEIVRTLAERADVLIESFRPDVLTRLGLGYDALQQVNPRLVYCSVSGFGPDGPNADLPAGDSIMQAYGGLMSTVGDPGGDPLRVGNVVSDMLAGTNAFSGVLLALLVRAQTGAGRRVGVSLLDSIVAFQAPPLTEYLMTGNVPRRLGNQHPLIAPSGSIGTKDGMIVFTVFDHQWEAFCSGIGLPDLVQDQRFMSSGHRQEHRDLLDAVLRPVFASRTTAEWIRELRRLDVLCSPVNDFPALVRDPQVMHNRLVSWVENDVGMRMPAVRNPVRVCGESDCRRAAPRLGEHSEKLLLHELGYPQPLVQDLLASGTVLQSAAVPDSDRATSSPPDPAS